MKSIALGHSKKNSSASSFLTHPPIVAGIKKAIEYPIGIFDLWQEGKLNHINE